MAVLTVAETDLPTPLKAVLRERAALPEHFAGFLRQYLLGFDHPIALTAALLGPLVVAIVYTASDWQTTAEVAAIFFGASALALLFSYGFDRDQVAAAFEETAEARRCAREDLKAGQAKAHTLELTHPPAIYEGPDGLIIFAATGEASACCFRVPASHDDARWRAYEAGTLSRQRWHWFRLAGSGQVLGFELSGQKMPAPRTRPVDGDLEWDAILLALGEPRDGDTVAMPLAEIEAMVARLL